MSFLGVLTIDISPLQGCLNEVYSIGNLMRKLYIKKYLPQDTEIFHSIKKPTDFFLGGLCNLLRYAIYSTTSARAVPFHCTLYIPAGNPSTLSVHSRMPCGIVTIAA